MQMERPSPRSLILDLLSTLRRGSMPVAALVGLRNPNNRALNHFSGPVPFPRMVTLNAVGGWNGHAAF